MLKEFKEFALKGNLIDMAVGFVMGGAFATVVTAFIQGVFLPILAPIQIKSSTISNSTIHITSLLIRHQASWVDCLSRRGRFAQGT